MFFPNSQRIIEDFIIQAGDLLDSVIIDHGITISEMPEFQLSALTLEHDEIFERFKKEVKMIKYQQKLVS